MEVGERVSEEDREQAGGDDQSRLREHKRDKANDSKSGSNKQNKPRARIQRMHKRASEAAQLGGKKNAHAHDEHARA